MFISDHKSLIHRKVLIVDDQAEVRNLLVSVLCKHGCTCETAKDGQEDLKKGKENSFDAVVTDIVMPGMDGVTLSRELAKLYPSLPIMVMTGYAGEYSPESALAAGAREFILWFDKMT